MEDNKKKMVFEMVSAEEAKKIRASVSDSRSSWDSGVLCESGVSDPWQACISKPGGATCCYYKNGQQCHGICVETGGSPPDSFLTVKCKTEPFDK